MSVSGYKGSIGAMMLENDRRSTIEMTAGGIAIATGFFLMQLPFPWLPNMSRLLIALGTACGLTSLLCGFAVVVVGLMRDHGKDWPERIVRWWDSQWAKKRTLFIAPSAVFTIFLVGFILNARAGIPESLDANKSRSKLHDEHVVENIINNYATPFDVRQVPQNKSQLDSARVSDISRCPKNSIIIADSQFSHGNIGIRAPADTKFCIINLQMDHMNKGYDLR